MLGDWKLQLISDGRFWLDGGAMFGVVPKMLWARVIQPDEQNRIPLSLNCLLLQAGGKNILIDTGIGTKEDAKFRAIYRADPVGTLLQGLAAVGVAPGEVDCVINTHLHFDHCGGNTCGNPSEEHPSFPKATYFVQSAEMETALSPDERSRASYLERNWKSISRWELLDGNCELMPGLSVFVTPGHTAAHQSVRIEREGRTAVFLGDIVPTTRHFGLPWIMGYDLYPLTTLQTKKELLPRMVEEDWLIFLQHEVDEPVGRMGREGSRYIFRRELPAPEVGKE